MKKKMLVPVCSLVLGLAFSTARAQDAEGFESFRDGMNMQSQPKWKITGSATAVVSDDTAAEGTKSLLLTPAGANNTTIWSTEQYRGDVRAAAWIKVPAYRGPSNPKFLVQQDGKPLVRIEFFYGGNAPDSFNLSAGAKEYFASLDGSNRFLVTTEWTRLEIFWSESRNQVAMKVNGSLVEHYYDKTAKAWLKQAFIPVGELDYLNNLRFEGSVAKDSASPLMIDGLSMQAMTESAFRAGDSGPPAQPSGQR